MLLLLRVVVVSSLLAVFAGNLLVTDSWTIKARAVTLVLPVLLVLLLAVAVVALAVLTLHAGV